VFCRECEANEHCNHNGQKILRCNKVIIDYMYAMESGVNRYYWGNSLYDEAEWFVDLLNHARSIRSIVRRENGDRKSKN